MSMGQDDKEPAVLSQKPGPGRPKLRSSCDGCGSAKLKCDRGQPACGRCLSYGIPCVYGLLQRMGKPPRKRMAGPAEDPPPQQQAKNTTGSAVGVDADQRSADPLSHPADPDAGWWTTITEWQTMNSLELGPSMTSFDFDAWAATDTGQIDTLFDTADHQGTKVTTSQTAVNLQASNSSASTLAVPPQTAVVRSSQSQSAHNCWGEAQQLLSATTVLDKYIGKELSQPHTSPPPPLDLASSFTAVDPNDGRLALDCVLGLNRSASERLSRLMDCTCATLPHFTLLYASVISRMLLWHQNAATLIYDQYISRDPSVRTSNTSRTGTQVQEPSSAAESTSSSFNDWSSLNLESTAGGSSRASVVSMQDAIPPAGVHSGEARLAIGTFEVDDFRVQAALKLQLLVGEMRRLRRLVEQVSTECRGDRAVGNTGKTTTGSSFEGVFEELQATLRNEHLRILNAMLKILSDLNS